MLDVRRLHVLTTVVDAGSVTAAASRLGYTASAVSQNISALERETGVVLLEKAGRGIRPTQAGLLLADHGGAVIARLRQAEAALAALRAGQAGRLRLAAFATAGATLVPQALARFRAVHPAVRLDLDVAEPEESLPRLRAGEIDVAVIALDDRDEGGDVAAELTHLLDDEFRVAVPRTHHLAGRRTLDLADLADQPWVVTDSSRCCSVATVVRACAGAGFDPNVAIEADEFATALGFVNAGLGVALLPVLALSSIPDGVRVRRLRSPAPARYVYAATRPAAARDAMVSSMLESLRESARSYRPATT